MNSIALNYTKLSLIQSKDHCCISEVTDTHAFA